MTEEGTRETIRSASDYLRSTVSVAGFISGGGSFEMTVGTQDETETTQHYVMVDGEITQQDYTEYLLNANGVAMSMSGGGNGFSFSFSSSSGNQYEQNKTGHLNAEGIIVERVNGQTSGGSGSGFSMEVRINPNYVYEVSSRSRNSNQTTYDYTRYLDENGVPLPGPAGLTLNAYDSSRDTVASHTHSATGVTITDTSNSTGIMTGSNTITDDHSETRTTDGPNGTDVSDSNIGPTNTNVGGDWGGVNPPSPSIPNPAAAGMLPDNFFREGSIPFGVSLFGSGFGDSSGRAPHTNFPPIATGTNDDGTYWEHYDNGTIWIYRKYDEEGGRLIYEDWGRHVISLPDLITKYKVFLQDREKFADIDLSFSDAKELMEALDRKNNKPDEKTDADNKAKFLQDGVERIQLMGLIIQLHKESIDPNTHPGEKRQILLRLTSHLQRFEELGGNVAKLGLGDLQPDNIAQPQGPPSNSFEKVLLDLIGFFNNPYTTLTNKSRTDGGASLKDYENVLPGFSSGVLDSFYSDIEGLVGIGITGVSFLDPTPAGRATNYTLDLLRKLGINLPDPAFKRERELQFKFGKLGAEAIREMLFGSPTKAKELYDDLKKLADEDLAIRGEEFDAIIEFLLHSVEEISNFNEWTDYEKSYVTGQLAYNLTTLLIPGGAIAKGGLKAAKATKYAQLISKLSKSEKIAKLRKSVGADSKVGKLLDESFGDLSSLAKVDPGKLPLTRKFESFLEAKKAGVRIEWDTAASRRRIYMRNRVDPKNPDSFERKPLEDRANALFGLDEMGRPTVFLRKDATRIEFLEEMEHFNQFKKWSTGRPSGESGKDLIKAWSDYLMQPKRVALLEIDAAQNVLKWLKANGGTAREIKIVEDTITRWAKQI